MANETMRKVGWTNTPELMLESFQGEYPTPVNARNYKATYPLFGNRDWSYKLEINLYKNGHDKWVNGFVRAEHGSGKWVYHAVFVVTWEDEVPKVTFNKAELSEVANVS